jgi:cholera toxin transcriptional activator
MAKYLICGQAYFDDEYYELTSANDPESVVQLGAAASRCLLVLIGAEGQIVTKKDLLQEGWGQYGNVVSSNNINQAIAHIRKCFQALGIQADSIVTIPRIGYKTSDAFVSELVGVVQRPVAPLNDVTSRVDIPILIAAVPAESPVSEPIVASVISSRRHSTIYVLFVVSLFISTIAAFIAVPKFQRSPIQVAAHIAYVSTIMSGDTQYYVEKGFANKSDFTSDRISMLAQYPPYSVSAKTNRHVYINGAIFNGVYSYFLCRDPIERSDAGCVSYVILKEDAR